MTTVLWHTMRTLYWRIRRPDEERLEAMVGPPGVWRETRAFQMQFLKRMGLKPHHRVLDVGCGPLRGGLPLISYLDEGNYLGIDVRPEVVEEAHHQIHKNDLVEKRPRVLVSTTFGREELADAEPFDYIWCFQLLYHLDDDHVDECLAQVARQLAPGGLGYGNINTTAAGGRWKEFPFLQRPVEYYQKIADRHALRSRCLGQLGDLGYTKKARGRFNHMLEFRCEQ